MEKTKLKNVYKFIVLFVFLLTSFTCMIYAATGDILPDDGGIITDAKITSMITGTAPFDTYEDDGRDMSPNDDIVRSFDQVTYTIEATMEINSTDGSVNYKGGEIYIEATIPEECTYEEWDLASMAWAEVVSMSNDRKHVVLKYTMDSNTITIPGKQELSMIMKVGGEKNNTKVQPTFKVWLNGNETDSSSSEYEAKDIISQEVTDTSKPKYNVRLRRNNELDNIVTIDIDGVPTTGRLYGFITTLQLYNDSDERGLKGVEYPSGDIEFDIKMYMEEYDENGEYIPGLEEKLTPILYNYGVNYTDKEGVIPDRPMNIVSDKTASGRLNAPRGNRAIYYEADEKRIGDSIYDSGSFSCTQDGHTLHIVNSGYQFDGVFPVRDAEYDGLPIDYDSNEGCFSAGYFQIFVPFTEDTNVEGHTYGISIVDRNFEAVSVSGIEVTEQRRESDDSIYVDFYQRKEGSFWTNVTIRDNKKEYVHSDYDKGDGYGFKTQKLWLTSRIDSSSNNDSDLEIKTIENMLKFDDECFEPINDINGETWFVDGTASLEYKLYYAAKPDGTGWNSDDEMEAATREDLVYYESLEELKADNKVCVGFLAESQRGTMYTDERSTIYFPVKVKNSSSIGSVYQVVNYYELYTNTLDRTVYYATNEDEIYPEPDYNSGTHDYIKTAYDENGVQVGGTHNRSAEIGNSLLVIEADTDINIQTNQYENNIPKINYDYGKNEYRVDYKLTPYIMIPDTVDSINNNYSQSIAVRAYLPLGKITYIPGSCEFGDPITYIVVDDEGVEQTVLEWIVPDCKINEEINPIYFSATLNPQLDNNTQVSVKATSALKDGDIIRPELKQETYTVQVINLSSHRLYKEVEKQVIEKEEEIHFIATYINSTDKDVPEFQMLDILPYNGDDRGTKFNGTYKIKAVNIRQIQNNVEVDNDNLTLYISNDESVKNITAKDESIGNTSSWERVEFGNIDKEAIAIAIKGNAKPVTNVIVDIILQPQDNVGGDIYYNNVSAQTSSDTAQIVSSNVFSSVISREINGIVWYDKNINGKIDNDEEKLSNINVQITNNDGTEVIDTLGNRVTNVYTDENGYYNFEKLQEGIYNIHVELPSEYSGFTDTLVGTNSKINSHVDSNGDIKNIELIDVQSSYNLTVSNQNAGLIKENGQVKVLHVLEGTDISNPETITDVLYNTEIYKGELGEDYTTVDRLQEINSIYDEQYEIATVVGNTNGIYSNDTQYVIYVYRIDLNLPDYDLSLRKYITGVNDLEITDRIPNINVLQKEESDVGYKRSVFSWDETEITDSEEMIKISKLLGINEIYQYIPHELFSSDDTILADFVSKLRDEAGMKVTYLTGDPSYYAKPDSIKRRINYLLTYNEGSGKDAPITSIALDIEPWTDADIKDTDYSTTFKQTLEEIYTYAHDNGIEIVMVIPFWLDTSEDITDKDLYVSIIENSDEVVVMNYNQNGYYTAMDDEIEQAILNDKIIYSAAELQAPNDEYGVTDNITYYDEGLDKLFEDWKKLQEKYPDYNKLSFSYHNIEALKILLQEDKFSGNFEYKHQKQPLKVNTNDIVEYTISVYNEGCADGTLNSIVDKLPQGLEFVSVDEGYSAIVDGENITIIPDSTTIIPAFDGINLSQVDIKIKCKVTQTKQSQDVVLTNVAYINGDSCIIDGIDVPDKDSTIENFPNISDMTNYIGNGSNKSELNDQNYYYRGQEDDDDFEKVYVERENSHKITTEVEGTGGTISGQGDNPYETVVHGENSIKDIVCTPDYGYRIESITVNGEAIEFTENEDGTYTLDKFINMTEDKHIIVRYVRKDTSVIVKHVTEDGVDLVQPETIEGKVGDTYNTEPKEFDDYEIKIVPENADGQMTEEQIEVVYVYSQIKGKVTITKVDKDDTSKLLEGATYKIEKLDEEGNVDNTFVSQEKTTGEDGQVEFTDLTVGKYRVTEIKAPQGYELSKSDIEVEITKEQRELNLTATNMLKLELPETGSVNNTIIVAIIGVGIMAISVVGLKLKRKN